MTWARWPILVLLPGLLIAATVYDRDNRPTVVLTSEELLPTSVGGTVTDRASSWFCVAGAGAEAHEVVVLNPTDGDFTGTVTVFGDAIDGSAAQDASLAYGRGIAPEPQISPFSVPAQSRQTISLSDLQPGVDFVSATVEIDQPGAAVEHRVAGQLGSDAVPCQNRGSRLWYQTWGSTLLDQSALTMLLFNPFPDDAVVDMVFATENGIRESNDLRSIVVPGRSLVSADVGSRITVAERVSVAVTVRSGRIIAERHQTVVDTEAGSSGLALGPAVPDAATTWVLPGGWRDGRRSQLVVYNPSATRAEVDVDFIAANADAIVEPIPLTVGAGQQQVIDLATTSVLEDIEAFTVLVRSLNDIPVVVERVDFVTEGVPGLTVTPGTSVLSTKWISDLAIPPGSAGSSLVLVNPNFDSIATVTLQVIGADAEPLPVIEVGEGRRVSVPLDDLVGLEGVLIVEATSPIAVESEIVGLSSRTGASLIPFLDAIVAIPPNSL